MRRRPPVGFTLTITALCTVAIGLAASIIHEHGWATFLVGLLILSAFSFIGRGVERELRDIREHLEGEGASRSPADRPGDRPGGRGA